MPEYTGDIEPVSNSTGSTEYLGDIEPLAVEDQVSRTASRIPPPAPPISAGLNAEIERGAAPIIPDVQTLGFAAASKQRNADLSTFNDTTSRQRIERAGADAQTTENIMAGKPQGAPISIGSAQKSDFEFAPQVEAGQIESFAPARNAAAGVLKIGPTALKSAAQITSLLSGGNIGEETAAELDRRMKAIDKVVGTRQFTRDQSQFASIMADDDKSAGDLLRFAADHPGIVTDQAITTIGSMFLPIAAAKGASTAAKIFEWSPKATEKAIAFASMHTNAAMNAADTFGTDSTQNKDMLDRYTGAAASYGVSLLFGKLTDNGAEGAIARKLVGQVKTGKIGVDDAASLFAKAIGREKLQEMGEESGNILGEQIAGAPGMSPAGVVKRVGLAGALGGIVGGASHIATNVGTNAGADRLSSLAADQAREQALAKAGSMFSGGVPAAAPVTAPPISQGRDPSGIDPLTLQPYPPEATPLALPSPTSGPIIQAGEAMAPTEVPVITPAEQHANDVYGARFDEESRQALLKAQQPAAHEIEIDPNDKRGSIEAIAAAPITEVGQPLAAPESVNPELHQQAAGDLAGIMLSLAHLERQAKITPPKERAPMLAQIEALKLEAKNSIGQYGTQYGEDAASHMHRVAAETYHTMKGDYRSLQRPTTGEKNASPVRSDAGQVREGGQEGQPSVQPSAVQSGSDLQQQAPQGSGGGQAQGNSELGAVKIKPGTVDEHAHEAATSPTNDLEATRDQILAGNYKKGHFTFTSNGMGVTIENPSGSIREDKHNMPPQWRQRMNGYHYGYLKLTDAADSKPGSENAPILQQGKQGLDLLVKQGTPKDYNGPVFVIDQKSKNGKFDEHKIVIGPKTEAEARSGYQAQYAKGWDGIQSISQTDMSGLKFWARFGDMKKPYADKVLTGDENKVNLSVDKTRVDRLMEYGYTREQAVAEEAKERAELEASERRGEDPEVAYARPSKPATTKHKMAAPMSSIKGADHLLLDSIPAAVVDGWPHIVPVTKEQSLYLAARMQDVLAGAGSPGIFAGLGGMHTYDAPDGENGQHAWSGPDRSIGLSQTLLAKARAGNATATAQINRTIGHELGHDVDFIRYSSFPGRTKITSHDAPGFALSVNPAGWRVAAGDIMSAALQAHKDGGEFGKFLRYPLQGFSTKPGNKDVDHAMQEELFAQLVSVGINHPEWLKPYPVLEKFAQEVLHVVKQTHEAGGDAAAAREAVYRHFTQPGSVGAQGSGASVSVGSAAKASHSLEAADNGKDAGRGAAEADTGPRSSGLTGPANVAISIRESGSVPEKMKLPKKADIPSIARALNKAAPKRSYDNPKDVRAASKQLVAELKYQLKQLKSGLGWYKSDIGKAWRWAAQEFPELATDPIKRQLVSIITGLHSPSVKARKNFTYGLRQYEYYKQHGSFSPIYDPSTGERWSGKPAHEGAIEHVNRMLEDTERWTEFESPEAGVVNWLLTEHPKSVLAGERARYGIWSREQTGQAYEDPGAWIDEVPHTADLMVGKQKKIGITEPQPKHEGFKGDALKVGEDKELYLGTEMFGPKVGPFIGNLNGMSTGITVDVWATRTLRRMFGTLPEAVSEEDGKVDGEGPTPQERTIVSAMMRQAALLPELRALGIKDGPDVQGVAWFFEQQLYDIMSGGTESGFFSDGARDYVESKGHVVAESGAGAPTLTEATIPQRVEHEAGYVPPTAAELKANSALRHASAEGYEAVERKTTKSKAKQEVVLNIGLDTNDGKGITPQDARKAVEKIGGNYAGMSVVQSDTEPTAVITLHSPLTPEQAHKIAVALKQEAIVQRVDGEGEVYGPQADKWKPYNPKYFREHPANPVVAGADYIEALDPEVRDEIEPYDFPGGYAAYSLYEARKLAPKPSEKLKRVNDNNSFALWQDYHWLANVDGVLYGVSKDEDPDNAEDADEDSSDYVFSYNRIDDGPVGKHVSTHVSTKDVPGLIEHIRNGGVEKKTTRSEDRAQVTESTDLKGDGRGFTEFFTEASKGNRAPDVKKYTPVIDITGIKPFSAEYVKHRGNFDDHIATSIPGFREVQQAVGNAIVQSYPAPGKHTSATLLDIAASEGAFNKAITAMSDGTIFTLALDPNLQMAKFFEEHSQVPGADYDVAAFSAAEDEGKVQWTEDDGTKIRGFRPIELYDVVHEAMGFQFISNTRNAQFARVKELMKPDGIAIFEEKIKEDSDQWRANEAQKDAYKARYFTKAQMAAKAAEVLEKGKEGAAEAESKREQATVGMNDLMTTGSELETALSHNWRHVVQYWDAGNFKGYVASDSLEAVQRFIGNLPDLNTEFSTVQTPSSVGPERVDFKARGMDGVSVKVDAIEAETGRAVSVTMPAQEAVDALDAEIEKSRNLLKCLLS